MRVKSSDVQLKDGEEQVTRNDTQTKTAVVKIKTGIKAGQEKKNSGNY